jgi:hypothetical protein
MILVSKPSAPHVVWPTWWEIRHRVCRKAGVILPAVFVILPAIVILPVHVISAYFTA